MVVLVSDPEVVAPPGYLVTVQPDEGKPFNAMLPIAEKQVS
jgi:hypothetical protein